jgi:hypothetical protein
MVYVPIHIKGVIWQKVNIDDSVVIDLGYDVQQWFLPYNIDGMAEIVTSGF